MTFKGWGWELRSRDGLVGILIEFNRDFPWHICHFEPTPAYEKYREFFDKSANWLPDKPDEIAAWDEFYVTNMERFDLKLIPIGDSPTITEFLIHIINGKEAHVR